MKKLLFPLFALLLLTGSCKKDKNKEDNGPDGNSTSGQLIPALTGWKKAGVIASTRENYGFAGYNAMTPYDLVLVDNQLALLYSEDFKTSVNARTFYKVKFAANQANITGSTAVEDTYEKRLPNAYVFGTFIPNSFTALFTVLSSSIGGDPNEYHIYGESNSAEGASGNLGDVGIAGIRPVCLYPDGGFSMGGKSPSGRTSGINHSYRFIWQYPNFGNFDVTLSNWDLDNGRTFPFPVPELDKHQWLQTAAFRLPNHNLELLVSSYDNKVYFSVIEYDASLNQPGPLGPQHNFIMHTRQEIPNLKPTDLAEYPDGKAFILANTVINGKYTFLLGKIAGADGANGYATEVSCYQWQLGTDTFTPLYTHITVPEDLGKYLYAGNPTFLNDIRSPYAIKFKDDGTVYTLFNSYDYNAQQAYSALGIVNASGAKVVGKFVPATSEQTIQYRLSMCQYFNGSYYAVVHPVRDDYYPISDPKFRMEIVQITP